MLISRRELLAGFARCLVAGGAAGWGFRENEARLLGLVGGSPDPGDTVEAARRFRGVTLNVGWETGLQAQEPLRFSGPLWHSLTGIHINVVELGMPQDQFRRIMQDHHAGAGELDCMTVAPAFLPDLVDAGALEPLDPYQRAHGADSDEADLLPQYANLGDWSGRRYGLFDDGDALLLFYRRDLFESERNRRAFEQEHGHPLGDPRSYDWSAFVDAARFFTTRLAPHGYGLAPFARDLRWGWFQTMLRVARGRFFNPETMDAALAEEPRCGPWSAWPSCATSCRHSPATHPPWTWSSPPISPAAPPWPRSGRPWDGGPRSTGRSTRG
ncbi:MAG: extracellular solute-binding protein [Myxococcota bacterium]